MPTDRNAARAALEAVFLAEDAEAQVQTKVTQAEASLAQAKQQATDHATAIVAAKEKAKQIIGS